MSTTAEINAYLNWRAEREGKMVDVSPEAYERHQIIQHVIETINRWQYGPAAPSTWAEETLGELGKMCQELDELEKES